MRRTICATALVLLCWAVSRPAPAETPVGWRNDGTGSFTAATPPAEWTDAKNVLWKVALPGASYGAPVVVGDNLYVVSDPSELLCVRRKDGKVLWKKGHADIKAPAAQKGGRGGRGPGGRGPGGGGRGGMGGRGAGNTAATPVSDGKHVAAVFGNGVVAVYTIEGKKLWGRFIESSRVFHGHAASPLLVSGKLIVHIKDLVALDVTTGKESWRKELPATHASPVAAKLGKEEVIVSPAGAVVRASDGKILLKGAGFRSSDNSPVVVGDTVFVGGRGAFKLSQTKSGEVTASTVWGSAAPAGGGRGGGGRGGRGERRLPSPVVHDGLVYSVNTSGFLDVVDAKKGEAIYRKRLPVGQVYSSIALAGGQLYVMDLAGKAVVFKPGRKYESVAVNKLEGTGSCPTFAGDHLYVRGRKNLYCLSTKAPKAKEKE